MVMIMTNLFVFLLTSSSFLLHTTLSHSHSHTLHLASLLPHSLCTSGSGETPSTLQILHRHGPCHSTSAGADAVVPSLTEILAHDQSRVDSIQARLAPTSTIDRVTKRNDNGKYKDKKADLPVQPGRSLGSGNYIVKVGLGTPVKTLSLIFDTGSDLTWTQCEPCYRSCYKQQEPIFNPSSSKSYSNITCSSAQCSELSSATGNSPGCSTGTCIYGIQYGDQSFSVGFLSKETITITKTERFPNFVFGCGQNNQGLFGNTAGLLGLGRNSLSIVSQTASKYRRYFSYCLPSSSSSAGHLSFGKASASSRVKFTPFATSRSSSGDSFYFIEIIEIRVGGRPLSINKSVFQAAGGTIIDSGTVITRLPPAAYSTLSLAFRKLMKQYPTSPAYSILDTCYDFTNYTTITIPTISFTFTGSVTVNLDSTGILIAVAPTKACLAFVGNSDSSSVGIFGNTQQKTLEVVYDVAGGKLGFGAGGCK